MAERGAFQVLVLGLEREAAGLEEVDAVDGVAAVAVPHAHRVLELVAGAVIAILFMEVAVATPRTGVTSVGVPSNTNLPVPVAPVLVTPSAVTCPVVPTLN